METNQKKSWKIREAWTLRTPLDDTSAEVKEKSPDKMAESPHSQYRSQMTKAFGPPTARLSTGFGA